MMARPAASRPTVTGDICRRPSRRHVARTAFSCSRRNWVVRENSNMERLASNQYLLVPSRSKEDRYDINDASPREIYALFVPESTMRTLQSSRRRQHHASVLDRYTQAYRTAALH